MITRGCDLFNTSDVQLVRRFLSRRHVVFFGDSLTRYFYLALVQYLETGGWEDRSPHLVSNDFTMV
jgi:hypothetical protein